MTKRKIVLTALAGVFTLGAIIYAADHIDAPAVTGSGSTSLGTDITDIYAFQNSGDNSKMVFVINAQGLLSPAATGSAVFPSNVMYELNIDNTGDNVEDLVFQFLIKNGKLRAYGPVAPGSTGTVSTVKINGHLTETSVTAYGSSPSIGTNANGIKIFAGPRDDPFFFDLSRFKEILGGTQPGFRNPGVDAFAGTNVMSIVAEVPKALLGNVATINVWAETKMK